MKARGVRFNEWIKQYSKAAEIWESIPAPTRMLFEINIDNYRKEELTKFVDYLMDNGYCDSDVLGHEEPSAIDKFLILKDK